MEINETRKPRTRPESGGRVISDPAENRERSRIVRERQSRADALAKQGRGSESFTEEVKDIETNDVPELMQPGGQDREGAMASRRRLADTDSPPDRKSQVNAHFDDADINELSEQYLEKQKAVFQRERQISILMDGRETNDAVEDSETENSPMSPDIEREKASASAKKDSGNKNSRGKAAQNKPDDKENSKVSSTSDSLSAGRKDPTIAALKNDEEAGSAADESDPDDSTVSAESDGNLYPKRKEEPAANGKKEEPAPTRTRSDQVSRPVYRNVRYRGRTASARVSKKKDTAFRKVRKAASGTVRTAGRVKDRLRDASEKPDGPGVTEEAIRTYRSSVYRMRQARIMAERTAKVTVKLTVKAVKAAFRIVKGAITSLAAMLASGGAAAVIAIVIICMLAMIIGSGFGIFFSNEDGDLTMRKAVSEINTEYQQKLDEIKNTETYDQLIMSGSRANWPEVLSVYAVKTSTDPEDPEEVATVTDKKRKILSDIFWEMNTVTYRTETQEETVSVETNDEQGNIVTTEETKETTVLYIEVTHRTAEEMAAEYRFKDSQIEQMNELLASEGDMWSAVLYGIFEADEAIVKIALSQIGNIGGEPYWSWYGFSSHVEWCACFVSWCADQCGYIDTGIVPKYALCTDGVAWFQARGQWLDNTAVPSPGMIIFFDWDNPTGRSGPQDGNADHTGIVERVEAGIVYTVEGNALNVCRENQYQVGWYEILGYGVVNQ